MWKKWSYLNQLDLAVSNNANVCWPCREVKARWLWPSTRRWPGRRWPTSRPTPAGSAGSPCSFRDEGGGMQVQISRLKLPLRHMQQKWGIATIATLFHCPTVSQHPNLIILTSKIMSLFFVMVKCTLCHGPTPMHLQLNFDNDKISPYHSWLSAISLWREEVIAPAELWGP